MIVLSVVRLIVPLMVAALINPGNKAAAIKKDRNKFFMSFPSFGLVYIKEIRRGKYKPMVPFHKQQFQDYF
jgi:hypothetical protein